MAKVVRTDRELEMPGVDAALRAAGHALVLLPDGVSEDVLAHALSDAELLLMCYTPVTARVIGAAPRLKGIVKYGVGIDAIDIEAAGARGIAVVNVPEYAEETVAEGAFALLLALAKKFKPIQHAMDGKGWVWPTPQWMGLDLAGKTLGLVGVGRIGSSVARMALGFRMKVLGFDPYAVFPSGVELRSHLQDMLAECDFVSIHCVLNPHTRNLIGDAELGAMQPSAFLVNVSRGAIVDEAALLRALQERRIAGAALDVYSQEPLADAGHPLSALYAMDNVILSPHLTFYTEEAMARLEAETLERCMEVLQGRPVTVKSSDPRLRAQQIGVRFVD
ncbi:MAG: C-terminal binding protein [Betaproteobacteria bacterium]|nr:C-terminal binding protein [Betaproteobacteria bacterium]